MSAGSTRSLTRRVDHRSGWRSAGARLRRVLASAALTVEQVVAHENEACDLVVVARLGHRARHELVDPGLEPSEQAVEFGGAVGSALAVIHLRRTNVRLARSDVVT
jgi:hypothetical protein